MPVLELEEKGGPKARETPDSPEQRLEGTITKIIANIERDTDIDPENYTLAGFAVSPHSLSARKVKLSSGREVVVGSTMLLVVTDADGTLFVAKPDPENSGKTRLQKMFLTRKKWSRGEEEVVATTHDHSGLESYTVIDKEQAFDITQKPGREKKYLSL